ncbi:hypothetical protein BDZ94DRAFT_1313757 [Collybia nuda]|uniref:Uncharacterized protein n=1 Tax=Collybia nuda TaxID=64659 RepID=A0A9P5XYC3_9AGAR|nr:hypothetical protein BDZ94DRAFT_1313757 [Collybia nuda]
MEQNDDPFHQFFMESHKICSEAQFVISSLPNAEITAVEQAIHQLGAICTILSNLNDEKTTPEQGAQLMEYVDTLLLPLEVFLSNPPPPPNSGIPLHHTGALGRPTYCIDLNCALLLHDLGNTWKDIAGVMGITRSTLYNHMTRAGYSTARKEWSDISDNSLDEHISEIALSHPFIGSRYFGRKSSYGGEIGITSSVPSGTEAPASL